MIETEVQKMATNFAQQRETESEVVLGVLQHFHDTILDEVRTLLVQNSATEIDTESETDFAMIEHFEEAKSVQERDTGDLPVVRTKRNTQPLPELHTISETKQSRQSTAKNDTKNSRGDAYKRAQRIAKRNPTIKPGDLAKRADISPTYARRILAELTA
jgi:hypothetical protein